MPHSSKHKFPRSTAIAVAHEVVEAIKPLCEEGFLKLCGSLRRGKHTVGDIEVVYVPVTQTEADGFFETRTFVPLDRLLEQLIVDRILQKRLNVNGSETWGPKNKYAVHCKSSVPIDFFATTKRDFWNYVVCRTGGERTNIRIASAAKQKRLKWNPYDGGFTDLRTHEKILCSSEEEVFAVAGLDYLPPHLRA